MNTVLKIKDYKRENQARRLLKPWAKGLRKDKKVNNEVVEVVNEKNKIIYSYAKQLNSANIRFAEMKIERNQLRLDFQNLNVMCKQFLHAFDNKLFKRKERDVLRFFVFNILHKKQDVREAFKMGLHVPKSKRV